MKTFLSLFLTFFSVVLHAGIATSQKSLTSGDWFFKLELSKSCHINISGSINNNILTLTNGSERINLEPFINDNEGFIAKFSLYHSSIFITQSSKKSLKGYWRNYSRKDDYKINFTATRKIKKLKKNKKVLTRLAGKWETTIAYGKPTKLIGEFQYIDNSLRGTFRSETGDYRFLAGHAIKDSLYLSCFDGTHCYLFTGQLHGADSISGSFYSGNHYKTTWTAIKNNHAALRSPDSLTYLANQSEVNFSLPATDNKIVSYNEIKSNSKPTIIQIFGSWCPNCVDETNYLNIIHDKYGDNINIVGIGFEMGASDEIKMQHLKSFKNKMRVEYPLLLGGAADKKQAGKLFPMLNHIMSFPTLLVINQDGKVVKIHTGFNGPATGAHYEKFKTDMSDLLDGLVNI